MRTISVILLALVLAPLAVGVQYSTEEWTTPAFVPSSATDVVAKTVYLNHLYLANTTSAAVSVTIVDKSTNCNSGACAMWPTVSIAANSVYVASVGDVQFTGGIRWNASAANSVVGYVRYRY